MFGVLVDATDNHSVILSANQIISRGLYKRHTVHGDIFVKGIHVSCYKFAFTLATASDSLASSSVLYESVMPLKLALIEPYC